eukprot:sb/3470024/
MYVVWTPSRRRLIPSILCLIPSLLRFKHFFLDFRRFYRTSSRRIPSGRRLNGVATPSSRRLPQMRICHYTGSSVRGETIVWINTCFDLYSALGPRSIELSHKPLSTNQYERERNFKHFFRIFCRVEQSGKTGRFPAPRLVEPKQTTLKKYIPGKVLGILWTFKEKKVLGILWTFKEKKVLGILWTFKEKKVLGILWTFKEKKVLGILWTFKEKF